MTTGFLRFLRRNTIALLALFLALGGTTYAASTALIGKNTVASPQVVNGSLKTKDLSAAARRALKGNRGLPGLRGLTGAQGAKGATGAQGIQGIQGIAGTARAYATVLPAGTLVAANTKNVTGVTRASAGIYCLDLAAGIDATTTSPVATLDASPGSFVANGEIYVETAPVSCAPAQEEVVTRQQTSPGGVLTSTNTDSGFTIVIP